MKRLFIILSALSLLFSFASASESLQYVVNVDYGGALIGTQTHSSGEIFSTYEVPGLENSAEANEPMLPACYLTFEVPTYVNNFKATILSSALQHTVTLDNTIMPQEEFTTNEPANNDNPIILGTGYTSAVQTPSAEIANEYFLNGNRHMVVVKVSPVAYNHAAKKLTCYNDLDVRLEYQTCTASELKFRPLSSKGFQNVYTTQHVPIAAASPMVKAPAIPQSFDEIQSYLFLVPESLKGSVQRLADWKRQKGYKVEIKTVEDILSTPEYKIGSSPECFDKEASVREWMRDYYNANGAFYSLIIGNFRTSAPIRKFKYSDGIYDIIDYDPQKPAPDWTNPNIGEYVPTDLYFSDLVTDWDFFICEAGLYVTKTYNMAYSPTVPVGRLICWTDEQIQKFTDKVILYETYPGKGDASYLTKGFVSKHQDLFSGKTVFSNTDKFDVTTLKSNCSKTQADLHPTGGEAMDIMKKCGLMSFQGHGSPLGIAVSEVSVPKEVIDWHRSKNITAYADLANRVNGLKHDWYGGLDLLSNDDRPAIAYSLACTTSPIDDYYVVNDFKEPEEYNMASSFTVRGKYGGPAMLANTRVGYTTSSSRMEGYFSVYMSDWHSIGQAENLSKTCMSKGSFSSFIKASHNIIGDSEIRIWTTNPGDMRGKVRVSQGGLFFAGVGSLRVETGIMTRYSSQRAGNDPTIGIGNPAELKVIPALNIDGNNNKIAIVYVQSDKYLPYTFIVTSGDPIDYNVGNFSFRTAKFASNPTAYKEYCAIEDYSTYLNLGKNGKIGISAYESIESDGGIEIGDEGVINLECEKDVSLKGDNVASGGNMQIKAKTITLGSGFTIEKGGVFGFESMK